MNPGAASDTDGIAYNKVHKPEMRRLEHGVLEIATGYPVFRAWPILLDRRHRGVGVDMTGAGAIAQLANRVPPVRVFRLLVGIGLVVIGMTSRTIRSESRRAVVHCLGIALVTFGARQVATVIKRLVRQAGVAVDVGCPLIGRMAQVALARRNEVIGILAGSDGAVVTGRA